MAIAGRTLIRVQTGRVVSFIDGGPYKRPWAEVLADAGHLGGSPSGEPVRDLPVIEVALAVSQVENAEKSAVIPSSMRMSIGDRGILGGTIRPFLLR